MSEDRRRMRRTYDLIRFPPAVQDPIFSRPAHGAIYLLAWTLSIGQAALWVLIAMGVVNSAAWTIVNSAASFTATCLLLWLVIAIHRRLQILHGGRVRGTVVTWWMGPWDPVGRLVWLPVRIPTAWHTVWKSRGEAPSRPE